MVIHGTHAHGFAGATVAKHPNDVWTADFKGQFRLGDRGVCYPLTIMDRASRFILACQACGSTEQAGVRATMERVFREVGLPEVVRPAPGDGSRPGSSDASTSSGGATTASGPMKRWANSHPRGSGSRPRGPTRHG